MSNLEKHQQLLNEFIALANRLKDEGSEPNLVSAALMSASAVYTTYVHAGNEGFLKDSGVTKVLNAYEKHLLQVQAYKQAEAKHLSKDKGDT